MMYVCQGYAKLRENHCLRCINISFLRLSGQNLLSYSSGGQKSQIKKLAEGCGRILGPSGFKYPDAPWHLGHSPQAAPVCLSASLLSGHLFLDWVHPNLEGSHLEILYCTHKDSFFKRDHTHRFCLVKSSFLAVLGLHCGTQAPLVVEHRLSSVQAQELPSTGLGAPLCVGS